MHTLPELASAWGASLDILRAMLRREPTLRALGKKVGPTRCFSADEANTIRRAFEARQKQRAAAASPVS